MSGARRHASPRFIPSTVNTSFPPAFPRMRARAFCTCGSACAPRSGESPRLGARPAHGGGAQLRKALAHVERRGSLALKGSEGQHGAVGVFRLARGRSSARRGIPRGKRLVAQHTQPKADLPAEHGGPLGGLLFLRALFHKARGALGRRNGCEGIGARARAHRGQHARRARRGEDEEHALGRLLEHFQKRVRARGVQMVRPADEHDAPLGGQRRREHFAAHLAHALDPDVALAPSPSSHEAVRATRPP